MQTPEYVGSSAARMIAGLAIFLVAVTAGVWFATTRGGETSDASATAKQIRESSKPVTGSQKDQGPFFYRSIGAAANGSATPAAQPKLSYTLEIKVAKTREEAEKLIDQLSSTGIEAYYTPLSRHGQVVYRVRRGMFTSQKAAAQASVALKEQHKVATKVVKLQ